MQRLDKQGVAAEGRSVEGTRAGTYTPRIDIVETDRELVVYADLPGVEPEQLDIRYEEGQLTLLGKAAPRQPGVEYASLEYGVGDFHRAFTIGESIDASAISAEFQRGVLVLHLPKVERVQPRRIPVQVM